MSKPTKPSSASVRQVVINILAALALGSLVGALFWQATDLNRLIPQEWPRVYVTHGCSASETAMRELEADPADIALIPLHAEVVDRACAHTLDRLVEQGYGWLELAPRAWMCRRLAGANVDTGERLHWLHGGASPVVEVAGQSDPGWKSGSVPALAAATSLAGFRGRHSAPLQASN